MFCRHLGTALTPSFFLQSLTSRHRKASLTCEPSWVWSQLSAFCSDIADYTHLLRGLLSTKNEFIWTAEHNAAFAATKQALVAPQALVYYDPSRPTRLHTDASRRQGLRFVLTQKQPDNTWRTVQAGSRFLFGAESRYAMIELELLGIAWAVTKCSLFLAVFHTSK